MVLAVPGRDSNATSFLRLVQGSGVRMEAEEAPEEAPNAMEDDDVLSEVMLALAKGCNAEEWLLAFLSASRVCRRFHDCASLPHVWEAACAVRWCGHLKRREWMLAGAEDPGGWKAQYRRREAELIKEYPVFFMGGAMTLARPVGLHFFEPRYRRLIAIAMETDARFVFAPEAPHAGQVSMLSLLAGRGGGE